MLQVLAKSIIDLAMSIPQSILSILAESKFKILQYDVFTCRTVPGNIRCAFLEVYVGRTEPGNGQCSEM